MKLRNKKTGEIKNVNHNKILIHFNDGETKCVKSLAELNEEWEDYEEPKESKEPKKYWFINSGGGTASYYEEDEEPADTEACKEIGNYFETEEEAEKAVEKLKAWKRLKDTGCEPITWNWKQGYPNDACYVEIVLKCRFDAGVHDRELDLLFGGEE